MRFVILLGLFDPAGYSRAESLVGRDQLQRVKLLMTDLNEHIRTVSLPITTKGRC